MADTKKIFWIFVCFNFVLWSLVPLWRLSLPMDTQEAIVWGKYCLWGTTKHPPFSGWIAYPFSLMFGQWDGAMYILSQIFVLLGIVYIYRLAHCFLNDTSAVLAALLQFGVIYYNFSSVEFNVNVISLALWPMCAYYFWQAYKQDSWLDWFLFGIFVGLNLLNKYVGGILLIALGIFVILDKNIIKLIKNIKVYFAAIIALKVIAPHVWWLWQNDFEAFNYIAGRSHGGNIVSFWRHLIYPLKFFGAQLLFAAPAFLTYAWFERKYGLVKIFQNPTRIKNLFWLECDRQRSVSLFILCMTVIPVAVFTTICLISGNAAKSMWGFPCLFMWGTALFYFVPIDWTQSLTKKFIITMATVTVLFAFAYSLQCILTTSPRFQTQTREVAQMLEQKWQDKMHKPLEYVGGNVWYSDMVALYAKGEVKPMIWLSPKNNPWFDAEDFEQKGALVVAEREDEYRSFMQKFPHKITPPQSIKLELKNYFGKTKTKEIYFGFYSN